MSVATDSSPASSIERRRGARWWRTLSASVGKATTDLLFPLRCSCCEAPVDLPAGVGPTWCPVCAAALSPPPATMCSRCAAPCPDHESQAGFCASCRSVKYAFDGAMALGLYEGPLRQAVLRTKHARHERLAVDLGRLLASTLRARGRGDGGFPLDLGAASSSPLIVAAVPMFWLQRAYRGANGAERMAAGVAEILGLGFAPRALVCRRFLRKQSELKPAERRRNVREAFRASRWQPIAGRRILLVDDVLTTGATAHEAARALKRAGASEVYVAAVARGTGQTLRK